MNSFKNVLVAVLLLVGVAGFAVPAMAGQFDGVTIRIGTFGGKWLDLVRANIGAAFEAEGGKIEPVVGQPSTNLAKLLATRGEEPPFDVLETLDNLQPALIAGGFIDKIDFANIPNVKDIDPSLVDDYRVPIYIAEEGILYNKAKFAAARLPAPRSFADLADPKLKGHVSIPDVTASANLPALVIMAHEAGGSEANVDPALTLLKRIAAHSYWSSSSVLQTTLSSGDIWASAGQAGIVLRMPPELTIGFAYPVVTAGKSGVMELNYVVKVKGGRNAKAAEWIINQYLSRGMQLAELSEAGEVPVSKPVLLEVSKDPRYAFMRLKLEDIAALYRIDYAKVNEAAYVQKWNRMIGQ